MPYEFIKCIEHAQMVLSWYENMLEEEIPPQWMWPFPDELEVWFEEVRAAQKAKYSSGGESEESGESVGNEYADRFRN